MNITSRILKSWKFLPSRDRVIFKNRREAFRDFCKVSGANLFWQIGLAAVLFEFGFPTPDIVYEVKRSLSPDFDVYCKYGELGEFNLGFENKLRSIQREEAKYLQKLVDEKPPEARFGGIM